MRDAIPRRLDVVVCVVWNRAQVLSLGKLFILVRNVSKTISKQAS